MAAGAKPPRHQLDRLHDDHGPCWTLRVELPGVTSFGDLDLQLSRDSISLAAPGYAPLTLPLSDSVDADAAKARFSSRSQVLSVRLPCLASAGDVQQPVAAPAVSAEGVVASTAGDSVAAPQQAIGAASGATLAAESLLAELLDDADGGELGEVDDAGGEVAMRLLRGLVAGNPKDLRPAVEGAYSRGDVTVTFCRVLRLNLAFARQAEQPNRVAAYMAIRTELRRLLEPAGHPESAGNSTKHAPQLSDGDARPAHASPQCMGAEEALDASCLRSSSASKQKPDVQKRRRAAKALAQEVAQRLGRHGWAVLDNLLTAEEVDAARRELLEMEPHFHPSEIWVGKQAAVGAQVTMPDIRGDKILWMCGHHPQRGKWSNAGESQRGADYAAGGDTDALQPCSAGIREKLRAGGARRLKASERWMHPGLRQMLDAMDALALGLSEAPCARERRLDGLVERSDAMLAVYPPSGSRFQTHIDNTAGDGRRLTLLCYLNDSDWKESDGGALRLHPDGAQPVDVLPLGGRAALFLADEMRHEVTPTHRVRYSCNVWYYDRAERDSAQRQLRNAGQIGGGAHLGGVSEEDQAAARAFVKHLLGGAPSETGEEGELPYLAGAAEMLTGGAARVVSQVVGAPAESGPGDIAAVIRSMTGESLRVLRKQLCMMGMS